MRSVPNGTILNYVILLAVESADRDNDQYKLSNLGLSHVGPIPRALICGKKGGGGTIGGKYEAAAGSGSLLGSGGVARPPKGCGTEPPGAKHVSNQK